MVKQHYNLELTQAGHQFVIPGTEKPIPRPRVRYADDDGQFVIPGAEQVKGKILLARLMKKPLRPRVGQRSLAGVPLFAYSRQK